MRHCLINHFEHINYYFIMNARLWTFLNLLLHPLLLYSITITISSLILIENVDTNILSPLSPPPPPPLVLSKSLSISDDPFFIRYTLVDTFNQRWFLVQINYENTNTLYIKFETICVTFLARHLNENNLCNDTA